jgi:hypothetical protein
MKYTSHITAADPTAFITWRKNVAGLFLVLGFLIAVFYPRSARAQLNADARSDAVFMIGYTIWWNVQYGHVWPNPPPEGLSYWQGIETSALTSGGNVGATRITSPGVYATPKLGNYTSNDVGVIQSHTAKLRDLGVEVVMPDMSNQIGNIFASAQNYQTAENNFSTASPVGFTHAYAALLKT